MGNNLKRTSDMKIYIKQINIHDSTTDTPDTYLHDGRVVSYNGWKTTDYIPVKAHSFICVYEGSYKAAYSYIYNKDKNVLSNPALCVPFGNSNINSRAMMYIENDGFIRFSDVTNNINNLVLYESEGTYEMEFV